MGYAKYTSNGTDILKDGHKMFSQDIIEDLNRKSYLESKLKRKKAIHISELIKPRKIKGKKITPIEFLLKKVLKNQFKDNRTGIVSKLKECLYIDHNIEEKTIKCGYSISNGDEGIFMYDYERDAFILMLNNRYSYVNNQLYLFKKLHKWGFVDFN